MIRLGEKQELVIVKTVDFGVYLAERTEDERKVLLPAKQVPQGAEPGDRVEVFVYRDSKDRMIATTNRPKLVIGERRVTSFPSSSTPVMSGISVGAGIYSKIASRSFCTPLFL